MGEPIEGWGLVRLSELVERRTERNSVGNTRVLTISAAQGLVDQAEYFNRIVASKDLSPYFLLQRGDFAYNKSYSVGHPVGVVRRLDRYDDGVVSPLYICFRPRAGSVHSDFLEQMLRAGRLDDGIAWIAKEGARNHGLLNVGSADFFALYLDLPPLEEQRRIAEILDTIDETIQATERVIAKKERVRIGLVDELLGDRRVGTWSSVALESLTKLFADGDWIETPFIVDEGIRLIQTGNIGVGRFIDKPESRRYISAGAFASLGCTDVVPGDLLICRLADPVGRACIVPADVGRAITSVDCAIARVDASLADTKFLRLLMGTRSWLDKCERVAGGTTRKRISRSNLGALHVEIPGLKEQRRIADVVELVETDLERLREQGKKLRMIRRGLAVDLLSGRVRTVAA